MGNEEFERYIKAGALTLLQSDIAKWGGISQGLVHAAMDNFLVQSNAPPPFVYATVLPFSSRQGTDPTGYKMFDAVEEVQLHGIRVGPYLE